MNMKRFAFIGAFSAAVFTVLTAQAVSESAFICLGPLGEKVYADGKSVQDDERYVVIFTADGHEFAGFTADGHLKDPTTSVVSTYGDIREITETGGDGFEYVLPKSYVKTDHLDALGCSDGIFELFLLDTRVGSGYAPIDEEGDDPTYLPTTINAWAKPTGSVGVKASVLNYGRPSFTSSGSITTTQKTIIGSAVPVPVIVSFVHADGVSVVGATNTLATSSYVLKRASDVAFDNVTWTSAATNGAAFVTTPLVIRDPAATDAPAFYRIEVSPAQPTE